MVTTPPPWQLPSDSMPPTWFIIRVQELTNGSGDYIAQLLWQRGITEPDKLAGFLKPQLYQPSSPFAFGTEMTQAVHRLQRAWEQGEKVTIWGDFDCDGITATAVLWEGLKHWLSGPEQLTYFIPNRLTDSHGLSSYGLDRLAALGCSLVLTCDTGSTNHPEIVYARQLGIDVIVTDHHTLPEERPEVVAIINPRYLSNDHPLYHLSGVAVAYKLVEALYQTFPEQFHRPVDSLLGLVAIGLIADLVQLSGDCRYLAQLGLQQLQRGFERKKQGNSPPGITQLMKLCQKTGDRPSDISFGLAPRINAVSRIKGDAHFCVELLTTQDEQRAHQLANETETLNFRRQILQKELRQHMNPHLNQLDLSTTGIIILADVGWNPGILGLVAGQIAEEYSRPVILLGIEETSESSPHSTIARGSARSYGGIDLYQLLKHEGHLLCKFGGHPLAAGLSLPVDNLPIFKESMNIRIRQLTSGTGEGNIGVTMKADLVVTVADLGSALFQALKWLEPCGMGNPPPRLLIQNCWFTSTEQNWTPDKHFPKIRYPKTEFQLWDESVTARGFSGIWWGHTPQDIPKERCDAIVELYPDLRNSAYQVRLIAVRPTVNLVKPPFTSDWLVDLRGETGYGSAANHPSNGREGDQSIYVNQCPTSWSELNGLFRQAVDAQKKVLLAYHLPHPSPPIEIWRQLVGIAKYLDRTGERTTVETLQSTLSLSKPTVKVGLDALKAFGFKMEITPQGQIQILGYDVMTQVQKAEWSVITQRLTDIIQEEQFRRQYFSQVPLATIQSMGFG